MPSDVVLIVDDNAANLKLARVVLAAEGYDVCVANDAAEALRVISARRPRLILMDIQLPDMDGLELTRLLKADARHAKLVVVALTAYAMKGDEEKAKAAGCDGYVTKPIDPETLPGLVAGYLEK